MIDQAIPNNPTTKRPIPLEFLSKAFKINPTVAATGAQPAMGHRCSDPVADRRIASLESNHSAADQRRIKKHHHEIIHEIKCEEHDIGQYALDRSIAIAGRFFQCSSHPQRNGKCSQHQQAGDAAQHGKQQQFFVQH
jgi:hypothetical protein